MRTLRFGLLAFFLGLSIQPTFAQQSCRDALMDLYSRLEREFLSQPFEGSFRARLDRNSSGQIQATQVPLKFWDYVYRKLPTGAVVREKEGELVVPFSVEASAVQVAHGLSTALIQARFKDRARRIILDLDLSFWPDEKRKEIVEAILFTSLWYSRGLFSPDIVIRLAREEDRAFIDSLQTWILSDELKSVKFYTLSSLLRWRIKEKVVISFRREESTAPSALGQEFWKSFEDFYTSQQTLRKTLHKFETQLSQRDQAIFDFFLRPREAPYRARLDETLFLLPANDGEALRGLQILSALGAPHVHVSRQDWGALLENEVIVLSHYPGVKRVVIFELPGPEVEEFFEKAGLEVVVLDHHRYKNLDRSKAVSSLEQLMELLGWEASSVDQAIAANDRGYIDELYRLGLTPEQIRDIRTYDLLAQGYDLHKLRSEESFARLELREGMKVLNGVFIIQNPRSAHGILRQELLLSHLGQKINVLHLSKTRLSFAGDPEMVSKLMAFDFSSLGYPKGSYAQYSGGSERSSMFFGFRPNQKPEGQMSDELVPERVVRAIVQIVCGADCSEVAPQPDLFSLKDSEPIPLASDIPDLGELKLPD